MKYIIKNAIVVNEGELNYHDVIIEDQLISKIGRSLETPAGAIEIDAAGLHLLPGAIDDQVHFREPGLTHKGEIYTEAKAAVAGGVTSYMEMPNTNPLAVNALELEKKYDRATDCSLANFSFFIGATNKNIEDLLKTDYSKVCGVKIFMGSSTGDMLVDDPNALNSIFSQVNALIATHCECESRVKSRLEEAKTKFPNGIPANQHPIIRDEIACYLSSSFAIDLAKKYDTRLHILHITSEKETHLFRSDIPLNKKRITSEVCVHHLHFDSTQYESLENQIKCNPAIKTKADQDALWKALLNDQLDIIATDHAPHTIEEKFDKDYLKCHAGLPLVQHSLQLMLQKVQEGKISIEKMVEKMCHNPAIVFNVVNRGYIQEGYFADLVLIDLKKEYTVNKSNILYKCGWSPLENTTFQHSIDSVWVNGTKSYEKGEFLELNPMRLQFSAR
jgi:dihydroorotase